MLCSCECQLRLTSVGKLNVERVDLLIDSKLDQGTSQHCSTIYLPAFESIRKNAFQAHIYDPLTACICTVGIVKKVLEWNPENLTSQLPLAPDSRACLTLYIQGVAEFVIWDKLRLAGK